MNFSQHFCTNEDEYYRLRNFLRDVFLLNGRLEHSWHVARLDYWRWHFIDNCRFCESVKKGTALWEAEDGQIAGVVNALSRDEIRLHVHPKYRTPALEDEMLAYADEHFFDLTQSGRPYHYLPIFRDDSQRQETALRRGYKKVEGFGHHWRRDLDTPIPETPLAPDYTIRSMGGADEHPARSWASWRAFHPDEGDENYDGDWSWYQHLQSMPLYRRDLDIVAIAPQGEIAAFATIVYDDYTRSAVCVLVGTAAEHWRRGLGKAVLFEGMRRLQKLGCTRVFATANEPPADAMYRSVMGTMLVTDTWLKIGD
ncbi:MAG TPA: GNAT family N-acetyltransferase [Anaerolineales bacterium]|nr:GNAT family N-acetyltransferase [Anaerolineales bacterium]